MLRCWRGAPSACSIRPSVGVRWDRRRSRAARSAPVVGKPPEAVAGAEDHWKVVLGIAADHPLAAIARRSCAPVAMIARVAAVPAVLGPFPNVAVDVV